MKSTGVVRKLDELGRIVLPIELRNKLGLLERDPLEIFVDGSNIVLKKFETSCVFCGGTKNLEHFEDKLVCSKCMSKIQALKK
ncbi:MAG: AbrB/MazE/SpoVT family DNA-binding domain-containing protein [Lachnospiraceae bacterium]|jgi:transcriptional pleiotropic regulator of transition state genes|nr:AbrB/MazE/SpoVT family DNA-binding domain-containing protein [Lachnospiraceae bacterium]